MITRYRWGSEAIPPGTWCCINHGPVEPDRSGIVARCPVVEDEGQCWHYTSKAVLNKQGQIAYRVPEPTHCSGPAHHDWSRPGTFRRSWGTCHQECRPRIRWRCATCDAEWTWPPCGDW